MSVVSLAKTVTSKLLLFFRFSCLSRIAETLGTLKFHYQLWKSPWRNRLARSAVNRKAGGSSPPGHGSFGFINNNSDNYFLFSPATITVAPSIIKLSLRRLEIELKFNPHNKI